MILKFYLLFFKKNFKYLNINIGKSFAAPMRFSTMKSLKSMEKKIQSILKDIDYPFIVFHDEKDKISSFQHGTKILMNDSKSTRKTLVLVENGKHDLLINKLSLLAKKISIWIEEEVANVILHEYLY